MSEFVMVKTKSDELVVVNKDQIACIGYPYKDYGKLYFEVTMSCNEELILDLENVNRIVDLAKLKEGLE